MSRQYRVIAQSLSTRTTKYIAVLLRSAYDVIIIFEQSVFIDLPPAQHEAVHNLINLHLFPEQHLRLGQSDRYEFYDAEIVLERTGNMYSSGKDAITYRYCIDGPRFELCLLAVWSDQDQATADVHVVAISPEDEEAESFYEWLLRVVTARMSPRDLFGGLGLC